MQANVPLWNLRDFFIDLIRARIKGLEDAVIGVFRGEIKAHTYKLYQIDILRNGCKSSLNVYSG